MKHRHAALFTLLILGLAESLLLANLAFAPPPEPLLHTLLIAATSLLPIAIFLSLRATTTEHNRQAALDLSERRADLALAGARLAYFDVDTATGKGTVNARWHELLGTSPEDVGDDIHNTWVSSLHPDDAQRVLEVGRRYKLGELPDYEVEYRCVTRSGAIRWFASRGMLVQKDEARAPHMVGVFQDISARKAAEAALHQATAAAESDSRAKSDFLANITHEIRTPMHGIIGTTNLLLDDTPDPLQHSRLAMIRDAAATLLENINAILDFSKIDAGRLELQPQPASLPALVDEVRLTLSPAAHAKAIRFETEVDRAIPDSLICDPVRLRQVLANLVGNAIKFTDAGFVRLTLLLEDEPPDSVTLLFEVRDSGIGIPESEQEGIFEAFRQIPRAASDRQGSGLGLSIASRLVTLMGSSIQVESSPGEGSRFSFTLKLTKSAHAPIAAGERGMPTVKAPPRALDILVGEDNPVNQWIVRQQLLNLGHRATLAENGKKVLEALRGQAYDLVLLDIQMPEMNGYQTIAAIRDMEPPQGRRIPVVALTAQAHPDDEARCRAAGMDDYLRKPIDAAQLRNALARLCPA